MSAVLAIQGLHKAFGGLVAVDDLSFDVNRGEIVGLIGPNGSGKTTAINLIAGALAPDRGRIALNGHAIAGLKPHRIARLGLARTFQLVRPLEGLTCAETVRASVAFRAPPLWGKAAERDVQELLALVGLADKAHRTADALTYIDLKRLELARALGLAPLVLLLDEWLAGLNPAELDEGIALVRALSNAGRTIVMVEHVMDAIRALCGRCIVLSGGIKIAEGAPDAVLADRAVIQAYLGDDA
jgi:branched-chain amino acid transport system ATP-binding protein